MSRPFEPEAIAEAIIGSSLYMVLGTGDEAGTPWVSPVYYAHEEYTSFYWVSSPQTKHSLNLTVRPELSIVIFDSGTPINAGQAVYSSARAEEVSGEELEAGIEIFSRRTVLHGAPPWTAADVRSPARHRLYRATAAEQWILEPGTDKRIPVELGGFKDDPATPL